MNTRSLSVTAGFLLFSAVACSAAEPGDANATDPELASASDELGVSPVEDVAQYANCRGGNYVPGSNDGYVSLNHLAEQEPGTRATFATVDCIIARLTTFNGEFLPYYLQSFKNTTPPGRRGVSVAPTKQTFIFKRVRDSLTAPSECLKIKLQVSIGATDVAVTIQRVKQLPPPRADGLCADNGET